MKLHQFLKIPAATYAAIMTTAVRTFDREDWIGQTFDLPKGQVGSFIESKWKPFEDKLFKLADTIVPEEKVRTALFKEFTDLAIH